MSEIKKKFQETSTAISIFSKDLQNFLNEIPKLSKEFQDFQKARFSFFQQKILNLPKDFRQLISLKAQATRQAQQEHIIQFIINCSTYEILIEGMSFI